NNQVQVHAIAPALSAQDVEQMITSPLEITMANIPGILSYKATPTVLEIRTMEDNRLLFAPTATNQGPHKFVDWIMGGANHGKGPAGNLAATTAQCGTCHTNFNTKPASWSQITATNGNCYKCHYSIAGDPEGFLDPTK
ncbi:MAG: hypothetical protein M1445_12715, partial [Bacteroidetes bacterium]|nr:hypothetical protein [Bacteroidota bacterium]